MRVLHTTNLTLKECFDDDIPPYATLSHRWEKGEVSLQDFLAIRKLEDPAYAPYVDFLKLSMNTSKESAGYQKIEKCCKFVASRGHEWVWIDTCCIDKTSSAELSEAINSMWNWYSCARVCYAYLSDVENSPMETGESSPISQDTIEELKESQWFTRGWTLQELLAPADLIFVDCNWSKIASKETLSSAVAQITKIPQKVLTEKTSIHHYSAAERMSWASHRKTKRKEDEAYCLLGIFKIKMPLLYGEGEDAFLRLQQEILRTSPDDSIFAWLGVRPWWTGLLAESPSSFATSAGIHRSSVFDREPPYLVTNRGLQWPVRLYKLADQENHQFLVKLGCETKESSPILLLLRRLAPDVDNYRDLRSRNPGIQPYDLFVPYGCEAIGFRGSESSQSCPEICCLTILVALTNDNTSPLSTEFDRGWYLKRT